MRLMGRTDGRENVEGFQNLKSVCEYCADTLKTKSHLNKFTIYLLNKNNAYCNRVNTAVGRMCATTSISMYPCADSRGPAGYKASKLHSKLVWVRSLPISYPFPSQKYRTLLKLLSSAFVGLLLVRNGLLPCKVFEFGFGF
jgi:hypothetical protein